MRRPLTVLLLFLAWSAPGAMLLRPADGASCAMCARRCCCAPTGSQRADRCRLSRPCAGAPGGERRTTPTASREPAILPAILPGATPPGVTDPMKPHADSERLLLSPPPVPPPRRPA